MTPVKNVRIIMIILMVIVAYIWIQFMPVQIGGEKVFINVEKGSSVSSVAKKLKESGIIRNEYALKIYMILNDMSGNIKYGNHIFQGNYTIKEVAKELTTPFISDKSLLIPEGYTIAQIQQSINKLNNTDSNSFIKTSLNIPLGSVDFVISDSLEGFLFPDTYKIFGNSSDKELISLMLENFRRRVNSVYYNDIASAGEKYFNEEDFHESLFKIITVASLIEREVKVPSERALVASVIYNRLEKGMPLQIDATVSYIPGKSTNNKEKTTFADTRISSQYNTYKIKGLPIGPICNPGIESIKAAIFPEKSDYLYYVARKDGSHIFTKNFEEHKKAKNQVRD